MWKARLEVSDILESARKCQGVASLQDIRHAILERDGNISIIPLAKNGG
ncbi:MAG: DUF421 domain-containing protein [Bdellovibrionaceae bacterium]|nr:DUF421 domain-containing protein [Pseudobdellovibrionaceae bacterium]